MARTTPSVPNGTRIAPATPAVEPFERETVIRPCTTRRKRTWM